MDKDENKEKNLMIENKNYNHMAISIPLWYIKRSWKIKIL